MWPCVVKSACVGFLHYHVPQSFGSSPLSFRSTVLWSVCQGKAPRVNSGHTQWWGGLRYSSGHRGLWDDLRHSGHRGGMISQLVKTPTCANKRQSGECVLPEVVGACELHFEGLFGSSPLAL